MERAAKSLRWLKKIFFDEEKSMADIQLSGLRLWIGSLIHWPARQLQAKIEATERRFEEIEEAVQSDIERRVWRFERIAVTWAITGLLLAIAGIFLLIGLWLGFAHFALFQVVLVWTVRAMTRRWSIALTALGLLLCARAPFRQPGGIFDFNIRT